MPLELPIRSRTLMVEDDESLRELLLSLLATEGLEVHAVSSGMEALQWLAEAPAPDLILTDMQMPGMEGMVLVEALRGATPPATRLLGMSGTRPQQPVLDSLDGFLLKPFGFQDFADALQTLNTAHELERTQRLHKEFLAQAGPVPGGLRGSFGLSGLSVRTEAEIAVAEPDLSEEPALDVVIFGSLQDSFRSQQLEELYTLTLNDVGMRYRKMQTLAEEGDLAGLQREAHSIKGLCGMVGARELGALAAAVEVGTSLDSFAFTEFPAACARLRRMLDSKFDTQPAPAGEHE